MVEIEQGSKNPQNVEDLINSQTNCSMSTMGVALDSFVLMMEYAGLVAIVLLIFCLFSRYTNNSGSLNVFQRLPLLLPAVGFVITMLIVANAGITPMGQYQGVNSIQLYANSGETMTFTIRDQEFYTNSLEVYGSYYLEVNDSIHINITVTQDSTYVDTLILDVQYSPLHQTVSGEARIPLDPGYYSLQITFTRYDAGILEEDPGYLQVALDQPLVPGFTAEVVDWSTYQFAMNILSIVFILGGLCIGSPTKRAPRKDESDWKTTSEYEY